jgi:xylulokinase
VLFTPWLVGERSPVDDRNARAGFHNVGIDVTQGHLARAVMEGVAFNARWLHGYVEKFCKRRLDPIRIFGGGAVSDLWCQVHADVMDRTIERVAAPRECGIRGAAIFAGLSLGEVSLDEVRSLVAVDRTFRPDPATRSTYDALYAEFAQLHKQQRKMFARLNSP